MKMLLLAIMVASLTACETVRTKIETVEVRVPVAVPCVKTRPDAPAYQYGVGPWPGEQQAAVQLATDLEMAKQYGRNWEAATAGCIMPPVQAAVAP